MGNGEAQGLGLSSRVLRLASAFSSSRLKTSFRRGRANRARPATWKSTLLMSRQVPASGEGRDGVGGLVQQGRDPRPRVAVPATGDSARYLSEDERIFIADRLLARASLRSIARELGRSPSTISRELARNRPDSRGYHPFRAQKLAQKRRPRPRLSKLARSTN